MTRFTQECADMVDTGGLSHRNAASLVTAYTESAGGGVRFGYVWTPESASGDLGSSLNTRSYQKHTFFLCVFFIFMISLQAL